MSEKNEHLYDDIINLPHHVSTSRPRMSTADRAAQFAPFAALVGHNAVIAETARLTEKRIKLTNDMIEMLNKKLKILYDAIPDCPEVTIKYFAADKKKAGGSYITKTGYINKIDEYEHTIITQDKTVIPISDIVNIESDVFNRWEL